MVRGFFQAWRFGGTGGGANLEACCKPLDKPNAYRRLRSHFKFNV